jgi:hypothetical protein
LIQIDDETRVFISGLENDGARFYSYTEKLYFFCKIKECIRFAALVAKAMEEE